MNLKERPSSHLSLKQSANLIDAADYAYRAGMPLTRLLTFNLSRYPHRPQQFLSGFLKLSGEWLAFDGARRVNLWVLENPLQKTLNAHLLIHVPRSMANLFSAKERTWTKLAGLKWEKGVLNSQPVSGEIDSGEFLRSTESILAYMLKGAEQNVCDRLAINAKAQGRIYGKRAGWSESIGQKARMQAGYRIPTCARESLLFDRRYKLQEK